MSQEQQKITSAADYGAHAERATAAEPTIRFPLPSGAIFEVRRPRLETWIIGGRIPEHLLSLALGSIAKGETGAPAMLEAISRVSDRDAVKMLIFARELVQSAVVSPKLVILEDGFTEEGDPLHGVVIRQELAPVRVPALPAVALDAGAAGDEAPSDAQAGAQEGAQDAPGAPSAAPQGEAEPSPLALDAKLAAVRFQLRNIVRPISPDELSVDRLHPDDFWALFAWAGKGAKGIPVAVGENGKGTTVSVETVETFRTGELHSDAGANRGTVGDAPEQAIFGRNT